MHPLDEVPEHRLSNLKISDDPVFHGPDGHDTPRSAAQHSFGFVAHGQNVGSSRLDGNHGRFA
jgi:hypothetical protein